MKKNIVLASMMLLGLGVSANAATEYGTDVVNNASLTFSVGGVAQTTPIVSNDETFKVDRKVDLTTSRQDLANVSVVPGQTKAPKLTFEIKNLTNGAQKIKADLTNRAIGTPGVSGTDNFDTGALYLSIVSDCSTVNQDGTVFDFAAEGSNLLLYVCGDIPAAQVNGDISGINLIATAYDDAGTAAIAVTAGADTAGVDVVLADGSNAGVSGDADHDGKHGSFSAFQVISATMALAKSSCIVWDPVNTTNPKRIPGSVLRYALQATNTGGADATNVALTDTLVSNLTYGVGTSGLTAIAQVSEETCNCASPGAVAAGTSVSNSGQAVTVDYGTVANGTPKCAYFDVLLD